MGIIRNIRIITGLIIFVYVTAHLLNLSIGLASLDSMDSWRPVFMAPWQTPIGLALLYGSLLTHMFLGFESLYRRRTLRMSSFDTIQLFLALMLPPLIVIHILGTRFVSTIVNFEPTYSWIMMIYWKWTPVSGLRQVGVVLAAWIHGCMGLYYWMRLKPWWSRASMFAYPAAFMVPVAALLGFVEAGKDVLRLAEDPEWLDRVRWSAVSIDKATITELRRIENIFIISYFTVLLAVLLARWFRIWRTPIKESKESVEVSYINGPTIVSKPGLSILELSRLNALPHASVCGGRGRCATCRIRIQHGMESLSAPQADELALLKKVGATTDVRLACQATTMGGSVTVQRLLPADREMQAINLLDYVAGEEQPVVLLRISCLGIAEIVENAGLKSSSVLDQYLSDCIDDIQQENGQVEALDAHGVTASFYSQTSLTKIAEESYQISKDANERFSRIKEQLHQQVIVDLENPLQLNITLHVGTAIIIRTETSRKTSKVVGEVIEELNRLCKIKRKGGILFSDNFAALLNKDIGDLELISLSEAAEQFSSRLVYIESRITKEESLELAT